VQGMRVCLNWKLQVVEGKETEYISAIPCSVQSSYNNISSIMAKKADNSCGCYSASIIHSTKLSHLFS